MLSHPSSLGDLIRQSEELPAISRPAGYSTVFGIQGSHPASGTPQTFRTFTTALSKPPSASAGSPNACLLSSFRISTGHRVTNSHHPANQLHRSRYGPPALLAPRADQTCRSQSFRASSSASRLEWPDITTRQTENYADRTFTCKCSGFKHQAPLSSVRSLPRALSKLRPTQPCLHQDPRLLQPSAASVTVRHSASMGGAPASTPPPVP